MAPENRAEYDALWKEHEGSVPYSAIHHGSFKVFRWILEGHAKENGVHLADHLIAATAIAHNVPLLTLNAKHFKGIKGLQLA
ncbi:MAG: hypothetical protein R2815_13730 [Flavobacteriales bacterium]